MKSFSFILVSIVFFLSYSYGQPDQFWSSYNKFSGLINEGRFNEAKEVLQILVENPNITPKKYYPYVYNSYGFTHWNLGNIDSADFYYRKAEISALESENKDFNLLRSIQNNLALLFNQKKQFNHSIEYYNKSEMYLNNLILSDTILYEKQSILYLNRGIAFYENDEYLLALTELQKSELLKIKYNFSYLGSVYFNLARVYCKLDNWSLAEDYFQKSINQWISEYDSSYYQLGSIYFNYGLSLFNRGKDERALIFYKKSLSNFLVNYGEKHPFTSDAYEYIAKYYLKKKEYSKALYFIQQAIISSCPTFNDSSILSNPQWNDSFLDINLIEVYQIKVEAIVGMASEHDSTSIADEVFSNKELLKFALEIIQKEIGVIRKIHLFYFDQYSRLSLNEDFKNVFLNGLKITSMLNDITGDPSYEELAFNFASLGKSIEFQYEILTKQRILEDTTNSKVNDLRIKASRYSNYIRLELEKRSPDSAKISVWRDSVFSFNRKHDAVISAILEQKDLTEFFNIDINSIKIKEVQKRLHRNQTLLDFTFSDVAEDGSKVLYAFIVNKEVRTSASIFFDSLSLAGIRDLSRLIKSFSLEGANELTNDSLYAGLHRLYEIILAPLKPFIIGKELIIVPDEELLFIPFDALITDYHSGAQHEYLLNDYAISYLLNSAFLNNKKAGNFVLPKVTAFKEELNSARHNNILLPGADMEVDEILKRYRGSVVSDYPSKAALSARLTEDHILHFALHSIDRDSVFANTYMVLRNNADSALSNKLFDYEISHINTASPMVVLSSCGTATGKLYSGEGSMSLSRSFLISGSESVLNTYWQVEDLSSSKVMVQFYSNLKKGWSKSRALQQAKIRYLENASESFIHPYFWAGYQIVGNSQNIVLRGRILLLIIILLIPGIVLSFRIKK